METVGIVASGPGTVVRRRAGGTARAVPPADNSPLDSENTGEREGVNEWAGLSEENGRGQFQETVDATLL